MMEANRNAFIAKVKEACDEGITEESIEIANALMADGIALENIISALISMNYKNEVIDIEEEENVKRYASDFDAITLKFSVGRTHGIQPGNIVAAIIEECGMSPKAIGRIDVRPNFSLVDIAADKVDIVLNNMQRTTIRKQEVMVEIDSAPKRKTNRRDGAKITLVMHLDETIVMLGMVPHEEEQNVLEIMIRVFAKVQKGKQSKERLLEA